jgi:hypothetical protein
MSVQLYQTQITQVNNLYNAGKMTQSERDSRIATLNRQIADAQADQVKTGVSNANQANNSSNGNSNLTQPTQATNNNSVSPMPTEYWNPTTSSPGQVSGVTPGIGDNVGTYNVASSSTTGERLTQLFTQMRAEADYALKNGDISRDEYDKQVAEIESKQSNIVESTAETNPVTGEVSHTPVAEQPRSTGEIIADIIQVQKTTGMAFGEPTEAQRVAKSQKQINLEAELAMNPGAIAFGVAARESVAQNSTPTGTFNPLIQEARNPQGSNTAPLLYGRDYTPEATGDANTAIFQQTPEKRVELAAFGVLDKKQESAQHLWDSRVESTLDLYDTWKLTAAAGAAAIAAPFIGPVATGIGFGLGAGSTAGLNYVFTGEVGSAKEILTGGFTGVAMSGVFHGATVAAGKGLSILGKSVMNLGMSGSSAAASSAGTGLSSTVANSASWISRTVVSPRLVAAGALIGKSGGLILEGTGWTAIGLRAVVHAGVGGGLGYGLSGGDTDQALIGAGLAGAGSLVFQGLPKLARGGYNLLTGQGASAKVGGVPADAEWIQPGSGGNRGLAVSQEHITAVSSKMPIPPGVSNRVPVSAKSIVSFANNLPAPPNAVASSGKPVSLEDIARGKAFMESLPVPPASTDPLVAEGQNSFNPEDYLVQRSTGKYPIGEGNQELLDRLVIDERAYNSELHKMEFGENNAAAIFDYDPITEFFENLPVPPKDTPSLAEIRSQYPEGSPLNNPDPNIITRLNLFDTADALGVPTKSSAVSKDVLAGYAELTDLPMPPPSPSGSPSLAEIRSQYPKDSPIGRVNTQTLANMGDAAYGKAAPVNRALEVVGAKPQKPLSKAETRRLARAAKKGGISSDTDKTLVEQLNREVFASDLGTELPMPPREITYDLEQWQQAAGAQGIIGHPNQEVLDRLVVNEAAYKAEVERYSGTGGTEAQELYFKTVNEAYRQAPRTTRPSKSLAEITSEYPADAVIGRPNQAVIDRLKVDEAAVKRELGSHEEIMQKIEAQKAERSLFERTQREVYGGRVGVAVETATMTRPTTGASTPSASSGLQGVNDSIRASAAAVEGSTLFEQVNRQFRAADSTSTRADQLRVMRDLGNVAANGGRYSNRQLMAGGGTNTRAGALATNSRSSVFGVAHNQGVAATYTPVAAVVNIPTLNTLSPPAQAQPTLNTPTTPVTPVPALNPSPLNVVDNPITPASDNPTDITPKADADLDQGLKNATDTAEDTDTRTRTDTTTDYMNRFITRPFVGVTPALPWLPFGGGSSPRFYGGSMSRAGARKRTHQIADPYSMVKGMLGGARQPYGTKRLAAISTQKKASKRPSKVYSKKATLNTKKQVSRKRAKKTASVENFRRQRQAIEQRVRKLKGSQ